MQKLIWLFCLTILPGFVFGQLEPDYNKDSCYVVTEPKLLLFADQIEKKVPLVVNGFIRPQSTFIWSASQGPDDIKPSKFIIQNLNSFAGIVDVESIISPANYGNAFFDEYFYIHEYFKKNDGTVHRCPPREVRVKIFPRVKTYEAITPNDDDLNDFLEIENLDKYLFAEVKIFDRWGQLILERTGFDYYEKIDNSKANKAGNMKAFNGYLNGKTLPSGVYMYSIKPDEDYPEIIGSVTVIR